MHVLDYLKEKGLKRAFTVLYQYKIDLLLQKIISVLYRKAPLKNIIVIMSHNDFDCNGGAFYDYLLKEGYNKKYKIVWILIHDVPKELPHNVYCFKYLKPSIKKDYFICRAKVLTADDIVIKKIRLDQKSYYFTHGQGGISIKNIEGITNLPDTIDFCLISSLNIADINSNAWGIQYPNNKMINLGLPSNDALFYPQIKTTHILRKEDYKLIILWMPTFRKQWNGRNDSGRDYEYGIPLIESKETMSNLKRYLAERNYCLVIKLHPMQDKDSYSALKMEVDHNLMVLDGEDVKKRDITNQQLYILADVMLNDYSSAMFPFLLLNKPMGFVLSDLKDYKRGLGTADMDKVMIGEKIYTFDDLVHFFDKTADGVDLYIEKRKETRSYLYDYVDGNSCERIAKHMGL